MMKEELKNRLGGVALSVVVPQMRVIQGSWSFHSSRMARTSVK
jgi:hypothetical protein